MENALQIAVRDFLLGIRTSLTVLLEDRIRLKVIIVLLASPQKHIW